MDELLSRRCWILSVRLQSQSTGPEIEGKFRALCDGLVLVERQDKILATVFKLEMLQDIHSLTNLIGHNVTTSSHSATA